MSSMLPDTPSYRGRAVHLTPSVVEVGVAWTVESSRRRVWRALVDAFSCHVRACMVWVWLARVRVTLTLMFVCWGSVPSGRG